MSLDPVESFAAGLIAALEPGARRQLAREIAHLLRGSQQRRIAAQQNPDGSAYEPRKPQLRLRNQKGKVRRTMFSKLRTARFMKASATPTAAVVGFAAEVERIARVHQFGLRDRVNRRGLEADYPARRLLGITEADEAAIRDLIVPHLANRL
ncbi:MAG: phage virion morphogenesis protein [Rhodocyclales bacterium]|nr:phage virion morphogenesis protein [Rhodocyclales bacterium]